MTVQINSAQYGSLQDNAANAGTNSSANAASSNSPAGNVVGKCPLQVGGAIVNIANAASSLVKQVSENTAYEMAWDFVAFVVRSGLHNSDIVGNIQSVITGEIVRNTSAQGLSNISTGLLQTIVTDAVNEGLTTYLSTKGYAPDSNTTLLATYSVSYLSSAIIGFQTAGPVGAVLSGGKTALLSVLQQTVTTEISLNANLEGIDDDIAQNFVVQNQLIKSYNAASTASEKQRIAQQLSTVQESEKQLQSYRAQVSSLVSVPLANPF